MHIVQKKINNRILEKRYVFLLKMRKARLFLSSISARWDVDECGLLIDSGVDLVDVCRVWVSWEIDVCVVWIVSEEGVLIFLFGFSLSGRVLFLWHGLRSGVSINIAVFFLHLCLCCLLLVFLEEEEAEDRKRWVADHRHSASIAPPGSSQAPVCPRL